MIDIGELKLAKSLEATLRKAGFETIERLKNLSMEDLAIIRQMGDTAFEKISRAIEKFEEPEDDISVSLYECSNAHVATDGQHIYCTKGHILDDGSKTGMISIRSLATGKPLIYSVCQNCKNFDPMGPAIPKAERGWIKKKSSYSILP